VPDTTDKPRAESDEKPRVEDKPKGETPVPAPAKPAEPKQQDDDSVAPPPSKPGYAQ
jgi:hypothetical protein